MRTVLSNSMRGLPLIRAASCIVALCVGAAAHAEPPLVSEVSSAPIAACKVDPFMELAPAQREAQWLTQCGGDHTRLTVDSPRPAINRPETRFAKAEFGTLSTRTVAGVLSTLRFSWAGARDQDTGHSRSSSTLLAAGGMVKLTDDVDLQLSLGRQIIGTAQTKATINSSWRPTSRGLLFTEWSSTSTSNVDMHRIGALWWLIPSRLAVDFGARYVPDGAGWRDQRIGLTFTGLKF